jgi:hypothetical protein
VHAFAWCAVKFGEHPQVAIEQPQTERGSGDCGELLGHTEARKETVNLIV